VPITLDERTKREIEARKVPSTEVCDAAEMEVVMGGKKYCVLRESIPNED
jgi:hypothetical protein